MTKSNSKYLLPVILLILFGFFCATASADRTVYKLSGACTTLELDQLIKKSACHPEVDFSLTDAATEMGNNVISLTIKNKQQQSIILVGRIRNIKSGSHRFDFKFAKLFYFDKDKNRKILLKGKCTIKGPLFSTDKVVDYSNTHLRCKNANNEKPFHVQYNFARQEFIKVFRH